MKHRTITNTLAQIGALSLALPFWYWGATDNSTLLMFVGATVFCAGASIVEARS